MPKIPVKLFLGLFLISSSAFGQLANQIIDHGKALLDQGENFGALMVFEEAMDLDSSNGEILYHYAKSLAAVNNPNKASRYYLKAYLLGLGNSYPDLSFELAEAYRNSGEYRKAKRYYNQAIRPYRRDKDSYWYKRIAQSKRSASWASSQKDNSEANVTNLEASNSGQSEFSAIKQNNQLYFTAQIADTMLPGGQVLDKDYYAQLYFLKGNQIEKISVEKHKDLKDKHLANLRFGENQEVYFSVCDTNYSCEIWTGEYKNYSIKNPNPLNHNINAKGSNNTQAQWVKIKEKEYLFFVSDRDRGFGGYDIWVAEKASFGFDVPINLGAEINSPGNEISPHFQEKSKTLYFSSDWHEGFGSYDIFKASGGPMQYNKAENIKQGINSSADDYYFFPSDGIALLSSNRAQSNKSGKQNCCNDIYQVPYEEEIPKETDPEKIEVSVETLNNYLPLNLYFHNDYPNPNSRDTNTNSNYLNLAKNYLLLQSEYKKKYSSTFPDSLYEDAVDEISQFFTEGIDAGIASLNFFSPLLLKELQKGTKVELTIKGYASSLSGSDYNLNLTLRRIQSLINYFADYESGVFLPYLNNTAENGGSLSINKMPFGEFASEHKELESNKILAVYSPLAAKQRKIEVLAVTESNDAKGIANKGDQKMPLLELKQNVYELGQLANQKSKSFSIPIKNTGDAQMLVYTVNTNCECAKVKYPKRLASGEQGFLQVEINLENLNGDVNVVLSVFSNTQPNIHEIEINFSLP